MMVFNRKSQGLNSKCGPSAMSHPRSPRSREINFQLLVGFDHELLIFRSVLSVSRSH